MRCWVLELVVTPGKSHWWFYQLFGCRKTGVAALAPYVLGVHNVLVLTPSVIIAHVKFMRLSVKQVMHEHPSFYEKWRIVESCILCPSTNGIILKASRLRDHLVYNNELFVVNMHRIGEYNRRYRQTETWASDCEWSSPLSGTNVEDSSR